MAGTTIVITSGKGGVGKSDDGLRQITQHDWRGDAPNLTIRNGSL